MIAVSFFSTSVGRASQPGAFPHLARRTASLISSNEIMSSKPVSTGGVLVGEGQVLVLVLHSYHCY